MFIVYVVGYIRYFVDALETRKLKYLGNGNAAV